jgi:protein-tyrosine kinase
MNHMHIPAVVPAKENLPTLRGRTIGDILVDFGKLTPEQVDAIVRKQHDSNLPFGEAGMALRLLTQDDILFALSKQYDYAYLSHDTTDLSTELVVAYKPFSTVGEDIRALRSQLQLRWFGPDPMRKALAIVSPETGEGKSFLAANLAVSFAQQGVKTLLIDANLRNSRQQAIFRLNKSPGLSSVLSERINVASAIEPVSAIPNLCVLPSGPLPPNPAELLSKPVMARTLLHAIGNFDVVLIDTPAGEGFSDASIIASRTAAALIVTRKNKSSLPKTAKWCKSLQEMGVSVVGSMLNDV